MIITSASCAEQDRDEIPGLSAAEAIGDEKTMGALGIDLKRTWRPGAVGRERTEGAIDRGWALEDVVRRWGEGGEEEEWGMGVMGQMEGCFLMVLTLGNFSCLEEWKRVLGLVLTCKTLIKKREEWFSGFLHQLRRQLAHGDDVEGGLFDMSDEGAGYLRELLKGFKRNLDEVFDDDDDDAAAATAAATGDTHHKNNRQERQEVGGQSINHAFKNLERFLHAEYGWDLSDDFLRRGLLELEDGEQVEVEMDELLGEDERGEYAPVVVDLD